MSTRTKDSQAAHDVNDVRVVGRVTSDAVSVELPSGDQLVTFRISVERAGASATSRQKVDSVPCCAWVGRVRRSAMIWRTGDVVEVNGAVRCRFFQTARGLGSRVEVEATSARLIRRAPVA